MTNKKFSIKNIEPPKKMESTAQRKSGTFTGKKFSNTQKDPLGVRTSGGP